MMFLRPLIALLSLVWIPTAQANTMVWFEAVPTSPNASVIIQGPGQTLRLVCDFSDSPCTWQVSIKAALGARGVVGWSLDLRTAPGNGVSILNPQIAPSPFNFNTSPGTVGSGPSLLFAAHGMTFSPPRPQTVTLLTFTLRRTFMPGSFSTVSILGGPSTDNSVVWANDSTGDYEVVQFGPNPPAPAIDGTFGSFPLIAVETPEPASLTLLAFGAAVCLRRQRRTT